MRATESGRLRYLLPGAAFVGAGFNIKMLQAFLPLPTFYALYFFGSGQRILVKVGRLALATLVLLVVSLSWVAVVDLTPAATRPYVGSSGDNTESSLIVGYNGLQRLLGMGARLSVGGAQPAGRRFSAPGSGAGMPGLPPAAPGGSGQGRASPGRRFPGSGGPGRFPGRPAEQFPSGGSSGRLQPAWTDGRLTFV